MKNLALLLLITSLFATSFSQESNLEAVKQNASALAEKQKPGGGEEEFENAAQQTLASERVKALQKFISDFPESDRKIRAQEMIVGSRAELADEKLRLSEIEEGIQLFKIAVEEAPSPISDKLFSGLLVKFPANLFFRGQRKAANEVARMIEERVADNPKRLLGLATFYLSTENAFEAKRLAEKSIELEPNSSAAYHTIGFAHRLNFELEQSAAAFSKALEIAPTSINSKISLAEMYRALGKSDEAAALYREILESDPGNSNAQSGLILSLFSSGQKDEAEGGMLKSLEQNPKNMVLLVGAAYWYASNNDGAKAVELSQQVLTFEPRYTWTYIALARGFMQLGDPLSAERSLLAARQYGNFPTLEYELASTRAAAGFYREAAEGLKNSFKIENGLLTTKLGGRIEKEADNFIDLLSLERRASIFQMSSADTVSNSATLKNLLEFSKNLESEESTESVLETSADNFISGEDDMKFHRQLFVANQLLEKKKALPKILEITADAVSGVDRALNVSAPSAAVLADELYESRKIAVARGRTVVVPEIPKPTLSKIMRGRIEEISGWTLFRQEKTEEAKSRLRLANSVLPKDSVWSRSALWRLGMILEEEGKTKEALEAYIKGYFAEDEQTAKRIVIANLYARVNGSLNGLDERLQNKSPATDVGSIFTGKPTSQKTEKLDESDTTIKESEDDSVETVASLNAENVPDRVPIAASTPVVKPTPNPLDVETKDSKVEISAEKKLPDDPISPNKKPDLVKAESKAEIENGILEPDANISALNIKNDESDKKTDAQTADSSNGVAKDGALFESVIIRVPAAKAKEGREREDLVKKVDSENPNPVSDSAEKKESEKILADSGLVKKDESEKSAADKTIEKTSLDGEKKPAEKVADDATEDESKSETADPKAKKPTDKQKNESGLERPRVVAEKKAEDDGEETTEPLEKQTCEIFVSQDVMTIINGGGSLGILVGIEEGKGDPQKIKAISSSPEDVEIVFERDIGALSGRAFFIVKSISSIQGLFSVTFETPCGKKEIPVKVR